MTNILKTLSIATFIVSILLADFSYDDHGNISSIYIPQSGAVKYSHDQLHRLSEALFSDGKCFLYEYDLNSNLKSISGMQGKTLYEHDGFGRLKRVQLPDGNRIDYEYDIVGKVTSITYPDRSCVDYEYDCRGRLSSVRFEDGVMLYEYDDTTNLVTKEILPNGVSTSYLYAQNLKIAEVKHTDASGGLLRQFKYDYDPAGNIILSIENTPYRSKTTRFTYDQLSRLIDVEDDSGSFEKYTYDGAGNRLSKITNDEAIHYTYDNHNRLIQAGETTYEYDVVGNLKSENSPSQKVSYSYDPTGKLISWSNGKDLVNFEYDGQGCRVARTVNGKTTLYVNDPQCPISRVLAETDEAGCIKKRYIYGHSRICQQDDNLTSYFLYDQPGKSVSTICKSAETNQLSYDSFGNRLDDCTDEPYGYNGEECDSVTGLIFLRNRYYNPGVGRFITPDYILGDLYNPQSLNPYVFVQNNPLTYIDPLGLDLKVPLTFYGNRPSVPVPNGCSRVGHGWIGGVDKHGNYFTQGAWPTGKTIRSNETEKSLCPTTVRMTVWVTPAQQLSAIRASSEPVWTLKNNCIDHAAKALDAINYPHPSFKSPAGISMPKNFCNWIVNERNNIHPNFLPKPGDTLVDYAIPKPLQNLIPTHSKFGPFVPNYGGVLLDKSAEFFTELSSIDGVLYDEQMGQMIMYGKKSVSLPHMDTDDLAVAVRSIYGLGSKSPESPGVSMEPGPRPDKPKKLCMLAKYFGDTENTRFGQVMFEADRVLKVLTLGFDNISHKKIKSSVPGYLSLQAIRQQEGFLPPNTLCRLWFVPKKITLSESPDGTAMVFNDAQMEVLTESTLQKAPVEDKAAEKFASHFTEHYNQFANEYPILNDLKRLGKITAIVKWVQENDLPFDLTFFNEYKPQYVNTPKHSPIAFQMIHNQYTLGGVVYTLDDKNYATQESNQPISVKNTILQARPSDEALTWNFGHGKTAVAKNVVKSLKVGEVHKTFVDLGYPAYGQVPLAFARTYSSFNDNSSPLGKGWEMVPASIHFQSKKRLVGFSGGTQKELYPQITLRSEGYESILKLSGLNSQKQPIYKLDGDGAYLLSDDNSFLLIRANERLKFNCRGQLTDIQDCKGNGLHYSYEHNKLSLITDYIGRTISFEYANNHLKSATTSSGKSIDYNHTPQGQLESISDQQGLLEKYTYDKSNRLVGIYSACGNQIFAASYDQHSRATQQTSGTRSTSNQYSLKARSALISNGNSSYEQHFDLQYRPKLIKDALGHETHLSYDEHGINQMITSTGLETRYQSDENGNITETEDALQGKRTYSYNPAGQLIQETDGLGRSTQYHYDSDGLLITSVHHPAANDTQPTISCRDYDLDSGLLQCITLPDGREQIWSYNDQGLPTKVTLPSGIVIATKYDKHDRQISVSAAGVLTNYTYDQRDNITKISRGDVSSEMTYDQAGNLTSYVHPSGTKTKYHYDAHERINNVEDATSGVAAYEYSSSRLQKIIFPNGAVRELITDEHGRLVGMR